MGKWKCLYCAKVIEGESFMNLVKTTASIERGRHVHAWENITLAGEEIAALKNKMLGA